MRVPLGLPAAARIADELGFFLPTTRIVDAIYEQAEVQLAPAPMEPTSAMVTTDYMRRHDATVTRQRARATRFLDMLTAGQKKDLVLTTRLYRQPRPGRDLRLAPPQRAPRSSRCRPYTAPNMRITATASAWSAASPM